MKKIYLVVPILAAILFLNPQQALALEVNITDGYIEFYQDEVLGRNSDDKGNPTLAPTQKISGQGNYLKVKPMDSKLEVEVKPRVTDPDQVLKPMQNTQTQRLNLQAPSQLKSQTRSETSSRTGDDNASDSAYVERIREQRRERVEEMTQVRAQITNGEANMGIESRDVKARVKNGAEFSIDAETNEIIITTPSGNVHTLNHLPDQAIERMKAAGVLVENTDLLDIVDSEDGNLKYELKNEETRKLFGFFPRKIQKRYQLDDITGEVIKTEAETSSVLESILNRLSF